MTTNYGALKFEGGLKILPHSWREILLCYFYGRSRALLRIRLSHCTLSITTGAVTAMNVFGFDPLVDHLDGWIIHNHNPTRFISILTCRRCATVHGDGSIIISCPAQPGRPQETKTEPIHPRHFRLSRLPPGSRSIRFPSQVFRFAGITSKKKAQSEQTNKYKESREY